MKKLSFTHVFLFVLITLLNLQKIKAQCSVSINTQTASDTTVLLTANPAGVGPNVSYLWDSGEGTDQITVPADGASHCITITDLDDSCSANICAIAPVSSHSCAGVSVVLHINSADTTQLIATATGSAPFSYTWAPAQAPSDSVIQLDGTTTNYQVTITDALGCVATSTITVSVASIIAEISISTHIEGNSSFLTDVLLYNDQFNIDSSSSSSPSSTDIKICADGGRATLIALSLPAGNNLIDSIRFTTSSLIASADSILYGYFSNLTVSSNSLTAVFNHPGYVDSLYRPSRLDTIFVIKTSTSKVLKKIPFQVFRAPILTLHGLLSGGSTFKSFHDGLMATGFTNEDLFYLGDYENSNTRHFLDNENVVPDRINRLLDQVRTAGYSSSKVVFIGHSMGGVLARNYVESSDYISKKNIQKLITLNTPHSGSQFGNLVISPNCRGIVVRNAMNFLALHPQNKDINDGAFEDLAVGSNANSSMNADAQSPNYAEVACHTITSTKNYGTFATNGLCSFVSVVLGLDYVLCGLNPSQVLDYVFFNELSDGIVPLSSQTGGLTNQNTSNLNNLYNVSDCHAGVTANSKVVTRFVNLLCSDPTDATLFSLNGFNPATLQVPNFRLSQPNENVPQTVASSGLISITSPVSGSVVSQGAVISVQYTATPSINNVLFQAGIYNRGGTIALDTTMTNGSIAYTIPTDAFGQLYFIVSGLDNTGSFIDYDTLWLNIQTSAALQSFKFTDDTIYVGLNNQSAIGTLAVFSDGNSYDVGELDGVIYTSANTTALNYIGNNMVNGLAVAHTSLSAAYKGLSAMVPVIIYPCDTSLTYTTNNTLSIHEFSETALNQLKDKELEVYPNPNTNGNFYVKCQVNQNARVNIQVFDAKGALVFNTTEQSQGINYQSSIKTNIQASGIYLLFISDGYNKYTKKIMIGN